MALPEGGRRRGGAQGHQGRLHEAGRGRERLHQVNGGGPSGIVKTFLVSVVGQSIFYLIFFQQRGDDGDAGRDELLPGRQGGGGEAVSEVADLFFFFCYLGKDESC